MAGHADGRYAPSPSGDLHLGNLRTALLAWLVARAQGGRFVLRIDDLDRERSRPEHEARQLADLRAIGLTWDDEPVRERDLDVEHAAAVDHLRAAGRLFPCWCSRADLRAAASAPHGDLPEGAYPGTCAGLDAAGRRARARETGREPAWRVRAEGVTAVAHDVLHGPVEAVVDDFVVRRADGQHAYNLAVVVDDGVQGVRQVVRGDDLRTSAPRQAWLADLLGIAVPTYAHVPLLLGPDGRRLAKRDGAVTLADRRAHGETPEAVRTALLAGLGVVAPDDRRSLDAVAATFDPAVLAGRGPTVWADDAAA